MPTFTQLVKRLRQVLQRHGRYGEDAEDLIQEAFMRFEVYRRTNEVREPEAFLVRAVGNLSIDKFRHDNVLEFVETEIETLELLDTAPQPDEIYAARTRVNKLIAGLNQLNPVTKDVFVALRIEELSYKQIAQRHKITENAVGRHVARAMLYLSEWMDEDE